MGEECLKVVVRVRPLISSEEERGCQNCITVTPGEPQIQVNGTDKAFTYDHVFGSGVTQDQFYDIGVRNIIQNIFKGYNVTILAYGQTGSGKTYSMGTNYTEESKTTEGIIPRAVADIFTTMAAKKIEDWSFVVTASFMELYNEQLYDLLGSKKRDECVLDIREVGSGVKITGLTEMTVNSPEDVLKCLTLGSQGRATGATAMNAQSSRSHAIFTISVAQQKKNDPNSGTTSKFHLVDLAGSERCKKTGAKGDRFKEGVSINRGLLALGNVISALGEGASHVGYRDSKLTRLLQDSLGGNSITLMIACVSPADYNFEETLSTLRYADRAKKIKNKPVVNQDPKAAEINRLNALVKELKLSILEREGGLANCPPEHAELIEKNKSLQKKVRELNQQLSQDFIEKIGMHERAELAEQSHEKLREEIVGVLEQIKMVLGERDVEKIHAGLEKILQIIVGIQEFQRETAVHISQQISMENNASVNHAIGDNDELNDSGGLEEEHAEHTMLQAKRNQEVNEINRAVASKEELIAKLMLNHSQFTEQSKEIQEMENEIKNLQAEKEQLLKTLEDVQANKASAKLAETRRQKLKELEKKITELTKKCVEQSRILKSKEKSDEQIRNLTQEIQAMKQTRVKLIRDMRKEADKFHQYKINRERELQRMRDQDRKRKNEMERLQDLHKKQQNVMKRKMEETQMMNKKLKDTLDLQKKLRASRNKGTKTRDFIQGLVSSDFKVVQTMVSLRSQLEDDLQVREKMTKELNELKAQRASNPSPEIDGKIADHEDYLDLLSQKISSAQTHLVEASENLTKGIKDNVGSVNDARFAIEQMMQCAEQHFKETAAQIEQLNAARDEALMRARQLELRPVVSRDEFQRVLKKLAELEVELEEERKKPVDVEKRSSTKANRKTMKVPHAHLLAELEKENFETDDSFVEDDVDKDPDWRKTPQPSRRTKKFTLMSEDIQINGRKRSSADSSDVKCQCKTKCQAVYCRCKKNDAQCSDSCGCKPEKCENRNNATVTRFFDEEKVALAGQAKKMRTE